MRRLRDEALGDKRSTPSTVLCGWGMAPSNEGSGVLEIETRPQLVVWRPADRVDAPTWARCTG